MSLKPRAMCSEPLNMHIDTFSMTMVTCIISREHWHCLGSLWTWFGNMLTCIVSLLPYLECLTPSLSSRLVCADRLVLRSVILLACRQSINIVCEPVNMFKILLAQLMLIIHSFDCIHWLCRPGIYRNRHQTRISIIFNLNLIKQHLICKCYCVHWFCRPGSIYIHTCCMYLY
jgi:hypothetical protein